LDIDLANVSLTDIISLSCQISKTSEFKYPNTKPILFFSVKNVLNLTQEPIGNFLLIEAGIFDFS
tara:strand:- start:281 stop:475 length:195 start_codon:yes stop_codon:yes gene_type:complete